jgi:hypothetical protein
VSSKSEIGEFRIDVSFSKDHGCDVARITGRQLDSSLWVHSYSVVYEKEKITVNIERSLKQTGMSGLYLIEFPVPLTVKRISSGPGDIVWERPEHKT